MLEHEDIWIQRSGKYSSSGCGIWGKRLCKTIMLILTANAWCKCAVIYDLQVYYKGWEFIQFWVEVYSESLWYHLKQLLKNRLQKYCDL